MGKQVNAFVLSVFMPINKKNVLTIASRTRRRAYKLRIIRVIKCVKVGGAGCE